MSNQHQVRFSMLGTCWEVVPSDSQCNVLTSVAKYPHCDGEAIRFCPLLSMSRTGDMRPSGKVIATLEISEQHWSLKEGKGCDAGRKRLQP